MKQEPNKWKKHRILVEFGFKTQDELENEVKRYQKEEILEMSKYLEKNLTKQNLPSAYIVSLIPKKEFFKLPNYIVKNKEDLSGILEFINNKKGSFSEIWCFEKKEKEGLNHVVGRILLNTGLEYNSNPEHIIEEVWSINHRDIERYHVMLKINYIRASRDGWNRRYNLDCVSIANEDNKKVMLDDFISVVKNIENTRDKIENLLEFLKGIKIPEISLGYMLVGEKFKFIDWDTFDDKRVIDSIFKRDKEEKER